MTNDWKPGDIAYGAYISGDSCVVEEVVVERGGKRVRLDRRVWSFGFLQEVLPEDLSHNPFDALMRLDSKLLMERDELDAKMQENQRKICLLWETKRRKYDIETGWNRVQLLKRRES